MCCTFCTIWLTINSTSWCYETKVSAAVFTWKNIAITRFLKHSRTLNEVQQLVCFDNFFFVFKNKICIYKITQYLITFFKGVVFAKSFMHGVKWKTNLNIQSLQLNLDYVNFSMVIMDVKMVWEKKTFRKSNCLCLTVRVCQYIRSKNISIEDLSLFHFLELI